MEPRVKFAVARPRRGDRSGTIERSLQRGDLILVTDFINITCVAQDPNASHRRALHY
jgi:hypothetical protein